MATVFLVQLQYFVHRPVWIPIISLSYVVVPVFVWLLPSFVFRAHCVCYTPHVSLRQVGRVRPTVGKGGNASCTLDNAKGLEQMFKYYHLKVRF